MSHPIVFGDANQGVDRTDGVLGAGDQGLMFGHACNETPELMPAPILFAHRLVRRQAERRKAGVLPWLQPDAKSQVTFHCTDSRPTNIEAAVLSAQHDADVSLSQLRDAVRAHIIDAVIPGELRASNLKVLINPTGRLLNACSCSGPSTTRPRSTATLAARTSTCPGRLSCNRPV